LADGIDQSVFLTACEVFATHWYRLRRFGNNNNGLPRDSAVSPTMLNAAQEVSFGKGNQMIMSPKTANLILALVSVLALRLAERPAMAQTSAFTYQGCLTDNNGWSNGHFDLTFQLFDASAGGNQVGSTVTTSNQILTNGYFSVALNFGAAAFTGADRWLQIGVRTNGSGGAFATLSPRQMLTPSPYALYTPNAAAATMANNVAANSVTGAGIQNSTITAPKIASGQVVKTINGLYDSVTLSAGANVTVTPSGNGIQLSAADASRWSLTGNSGTTAGVNFLGTADNKPLELRANNMPALTLTPSQWGASIVVGGGGATATGATSVSMGYGTTASGAAAIALGEATTASGWESTALGERTKASGDYSTAMGNGTSATNSCATALGTNTLAGGVASIAMGRNTTATGQYSTAMGYNTKALGSASFAMGLWSTANGPNSLADGYSCTAAGSASVALGYYSYADHGYSFVWNDGSSGVSGDIHTTGDNQFIIGASGGVGIGAAPGDALLDIQGNVRVNKHGIYFREGTDRNHGLGWYGLGKLFGTNSPDGPVLYG
jgi:Head domain of trimeric autotransporter adhesin